jgi:hypothetical protein
MKKADFLKLPDGIFSLIKIAADFFTSISNQKRTRTAANTLQGTGCRACLGS